MVGPRLPLVGVHSARRDAWGKMIEELAFLSKVGWKVESRSLRGEAG